MKRKTFARIIFWIIFIPLIYFAYKTVIKEVTEYVQQKIEIPRNGIVCVDARSKSDVRNGSFEHPFKTINKAIEFQKTDLSFNKILVKRGEYTEKLILPDNVSLIASGGRAKIKNLEIDKGSTITVGNNNLIANIDVLYGRYGIRVPSNRSVTLLNVSISNSSKWGIYSEKNENIESGKITMINSQVHHCTRQGLYLQKGTFYMNNSKATENGEEGIDLHTEMNSVIKNSQIIKNGEGGIETELGSVDLFVENTLIEENGASGINLQSFRKDSTVTLKNNTIKNNEHFGIRCALHSPIKSPYFSKAIKLNGQNKIFGNGKEQIDPNCSR